MQLGDVLAGLDADQRRAVTLVYVEDRSIEETARVLAVAPAVVARRLTAASRAVARWVIEDVETAGFAARSVVRPVTLPA